MNCHHFGTQFFHGLHRCIESCTLCTIQYDLHTPQVYIDRFHRMVDIFFPGVSTVFNLADTGPGRELYALHITPDQFFNLIFQGIRKLIAVTIKKLNAVKFHRIVRSRDNNTRIYFIFPGKICHCRSRHHTHIDSICTHGTHAGHQRIR